MKNSNLCVTGQTIGILLSWLSSKNCIIIFSVIAKIIAHLMPRLRNLRLMSSSLQLPHQVQIL